MTYASRTRARTERHVGPCQTGTLSVGQLKLFTGSNLFTSALIREHLIHLVLVHQVRAGILREDVHGGDRRLLRQPVRQRGQLPSARGGKIPVSEFLDLVIKCVNGKCWLVGAKCGQRRARVSQVPLLRHRHPFSSPLSLYSLTSPFIFIFIFVLFFSQVHFSLYFLSLLTHFILSICYFPFPQNVSHHFSPDTPNMRPSSLKLINSVHNICKGMAWDFPVMVC